MANTPHSVSTSASRSSVDGFKTADAARAQTAVALLPEPQPIVDLSGSRSAWNMGKVPFDRPLSGELSRT